ncbi:MAG TPA: lipid-A-disaccharide synthase [Xanthomonadales bacterium]|nr:lipid-A-disaccharide synthase [Xanthomonadales bacterium]
MTSTPTIALVAGETSGDQLGAALVEKLKQQFPQARIAGIGGENMSAAGMDCWWDCSELALFGLFEVVSHLPRLVKLRRELTQRLLDLKPDVFIGIDAPDFNLGLEIRLKEQGIRTVHYVSPTVWAWRPGRVKKIARAADLVLCLFPFEPDFYAGHGVRATYVGHPMADQITGRPDAAAAREELGLDPSASTLALLPGSRMSEVNRLSAPMLEAAGILRQSRPGLQVVAAMANERVKTAFESQLESSRLENVSMFLGKPRSVIAAADVVLCASGTATLETLLINRPMVMAYRLAPATYHLAKNLRLIKRQFFALPNILAREELIPELIQQEVSGASLALAAQGWLDDEAGVIALQSRFDDLHAGLRCDASSRAATAIIDLLPGPA